METLETAPMDPTLCLKNKKNGHYFLSAIIRTSLKHSLLQKSTQYLHHCYLIIFKPQRTALEKNATIFKTITYLCGKFTLSVTGDLWEKPIDKSLMNEKVNLQKIY